jgi:hypothetical protein
MKIPKLFAASTVVVATALLASCSKESTTVSKPQFKAGAEITTETLSGSVKGTMTTGKTYYFGGPITVNAGDTLVMQSGVKLLSTDPSAMLIINGVFISLGSKDKPNWITGKDADANPTQYKTTTYTDANSDLGLKPSGKLWGGIQCSSTCSMLNIKWTHLDFAGGTVASSSPVVTGFVYKSGDLLFATSFTNPNGVYLLEDSWVYGTSTDVARVTHGTIHFMRNTIEKIGYNDGDAFNTKGGASGNMAYNLFIGTAKGGTKASAKGAAVGEAYGKVYMYNNTYVNCGWRSLDPDRGANVDIEEKASGWVYNNIIVNCRTGIRFLENPVADTTSTDSAYGNNLYYGDSLNVTGQFLPSSHLAKYNTTDIPLPSSYYTFTKQTHWVVVAGTPQAVAGGTTTNGYDGTNLVGKNNPKFANYPLPAPVGNSTYGPALRSMTWQGTYDFHLTTGSPAIGAGFTGFQPLSNAIASISNSNLAATITPPNQDLGAFPTDKTGNQH